jgi:hypothetical protein
MQCKLPLMVGCNLKENRPGRGQGSGGSVDRWTALIDYLQDRPTARGQRPETRLTPAKIRK